MFPLGVAPVADDSSRVSRVTRVTSFLKASGSPGTRRGGRCVRSPSWSVIDHRSLGDVLGHLPPPRPSASMRVKVVEVLPVSLLPPFLRVEFECFYLHKKDRTHVGLNVSTVESRRGRDFVEDHQHVRLPELLRNVS